MAVAVAVEYSERKVGSGVVRRGRGVQQQK